LLWLLAGCVVVLRRGAATRIVFGKSSAIFLMAGSLIHAPEEGTYELHDECNELVALLCRCRSRTLSGVAARVQTLLGLITGGIEAILRRTVFWNGMHVLDLTLDRLFKFAHAPA